MLDLRKQVEIRLQEWLDLCSEHDMRAILAYLESVTEQPGAPTDTSGFGDSCIIKVNRGKEN
jgi:hypothetical protein